MKGATTNQATTGSWPGRWRVVPRPVKLAFVLLFTLVSMALAHDPYEITSQLFVHSNRIQVNLEMELSAAMLLAGRAARAESPTEEFARALPELRERAGDILRLTANARPWPADATNVALGVENHVSVELQYPGAEASALRIEVGALRALSDHGSYGISLTVLDMVQKRVLTQAVLFGNSPVLGLESSSERPTTNPPVVLLRSNVIAAQPRESAGREPSSNSTGLVIFGAVVATLGLVGWFRCSRQRRN